MSTLRRAAAGVAVLAACAAAAAPARAATIVDDGLAGAVMDRVTMSGGTAQLAAVPPFTFDGSALPAGLTAVPWSAGGTAQGVGGALWVSGTRVVAARAAVPGDALVFRATFKPTPQQHIGLGDVAAGPWAIFSTGATGTQLYARTSGAPDTPIPNPFTPHDFRIEWHANSVRYLVDGAVLAEHKVTFAQPMAPIISDYGTAAGTALAVDTFGLVLFEPAGTVTSRVLATPTGARGADWTTLADAGSGALSFETRAGNTPVPDATWSPFQPVGPGDAIASPAARNIQYRATLTTADQRQTSRLQRVDIGYVPVADPVPEAPDRSSARVRVKVRSVRVTRTGRVALALTCPASEQSCDVRVRLALGLRTVARARRTIAGGKQATARLQLTRAARHRLAKHGRLRVLAVVTTWDAAKNRGQTRRTLTLRAP